MVAYLGLGSNLGDREASLRHALRRLADALDVTGISSVYETDPVGFIDQPPFLNLVVRARADLDPHGILALIREIEAGVGRERAFRNAPRVLDIDLLLLDDVRVRTDHLTVPHPRMRDRPFVLIPLLELDPELREPGTDTPYSQHLAAATGGGDGAGVRRLFPGDRLLEEPS